MLKKFIKILIPILIILIAVFIAGLIVKLTKKPEKKRPQRTAYAVEVLELNAGSEKVTLQATGTVTPAVGITLRARVSGEIVEVAPEFINGGFFERGDVVLKIDPVDYQLALEQKKAALAEAEYQLKLEKGQRDIAAREWELLGSGDEASDADQELALRIPHLKYRTAKVEAAKAELAKAKLDLSRTEITAPFNSVVVERKTDLGAQASTQDALATLAGTDQYYVRASIPVHNLKWIECDPETGSTVTVNRNTGDARMGRAIRIESALEEMGRMARVLIAVDHPVDGEHPMLLNDYVRIEIEGAALPNAYSIPRAALHEDQYVWLASPQGTLEIREVNVGWRDAEDVLITGGLSDGERLILTNLSTPINGMTLRIKGDPLPEQMQKGEHGEATSGKGMKNDEK